MVLIGMKKIKNFLTKNLIMQLLAWMWCIAFSLYFSSWYLFGITVVSHFVFIIAIFVTVMSFRLVPEPEDQYEDDLDPLDDEV